MIGREQRRKHPLIHFRHLIDGVRRVRKEFQSDGIVAKVIVEIVDQPRVGPFKAKAGEFDPVAPIRRRRLGELALEQRDGFIARAEA